MEQKNLLYFSNIITDRRIKMHVAGEELLFYIHSSCKDDETNVWIISSRRNDKNL